MANFSLFLANELLDNTLRAASYTGPATLYMALFTSGTNLETNVQTAEVSGNGYTRIAVAFDVASGSTTQNTGIVTFPTAITATWGTITHAAVCNAATTGEILYWAALDASKTINVGDTFKFLAGAFIVEHQ